MRIALALTLLALSACNGEVDGDNTNVEHAVVVKTVTLSGTTSAAATVTVDQQADTDGTEDTSWSATFALDGRKAPASLPADDGAAHTHTFEVKGVGAAATGRTRVRITIGE